MLRHDYFARVELPLVHFLGCGGEGLTGLFFEQVEQDMPPIITLPRHYCQ